jgi:hypothetical protein
MGAMDEKITYISHKREKGLLNDENKDDEVYDLISNHANTLTRFQVLPQLPPCNINLIGLHFKTKMQMKFV